MSTEVQELEALKQEYLSQLRRVFPLHRTALLFVALVVVVLSKDRTIGAVSTEIIGLRVGYLLDFDDGLFTGTTVLDLLLSAALLILGLGFQRTLRIALFKYIREALSLDGVAQRMRERSAEQRDASVANHFALKRAESAAKLWGKRVALASLASESAATLFLTFLYCATRLGGAADYAVAAVLLLGAGAALVLSFFVFLKHYLPHAMHQTGLAGLRGDLTLP